MTGFNLLLTSTESFPNRYTIQPKAAQQFGNIARRLYRVFAHAYYHHRSVFDEFEVSQRIPRCSILIQTGIHLRQAVSGLVYLILGFVNAFPSSPTRFIDAELFLLVFLSILFRFSPFCPFLVSYSFDESLLTVLVEARIDDGTTIDAPN